MSAANRHVGPVRDRSAWLPAELAADPAWVWRWPPSAIDALDAGLARIRAEGRALGQIRREDFPLESVRPDLRRLDDELERGRGIVLLRGLPVERWSREDCANAWYGIALHFGIPIAQNTRGELIGHVRDLGYRWGQQNNGELVRGYLTREHLPFHSDSADRVGLMCVRAAKAGGLSSIVSSMSIHNAVASRHPDLLEQLYRGFHYSLRGEGKGGVAQVTDDPVPVFSLCQGVLSAGYVRKGIDQGREARGVAWSEVEAAALAAIDRLSASDELRFDMRFEPGDIQLLNNYTTLHSRTEFEDWEAPERKRHLMRIWLQVPHGRPLAPEFERRYGRHSPYPTRAEAVRRAGLAPAGAR